MFYKAEALVAKTHKDDGTLIPHKSRSYYWREFTVFDKYGDDILGKLGRNINAQSYTINDIKLV